MDLLRANGSYTGARTTTDPDGKASFEILPEYQHKFKAYTGGESHVTGELTGGEDMVLDIPGPVAKPALAVAPQGSGLGQNFPNPFNPSTMIRYALSEPTEVRLVVYNTLGQPARVLVDGFQARGGYSVVWDGQDALGRPVSAGVYLYRLEMGTEVLVRKMVYAE